MGGRRRRSHHFLCFGVPSSAVVEDEKVVAEINNSSSTRSNDTGLLCRFISRLLRSLSSLNRSGRLREKRSSSLLQKTAAEWSGKSTDGEELLFTTSASTSSASSLLSSSSSLSFPLSPTTHRPKRVVSRRRRNYDSATVVCLLLVSLSVIVFYGRVCAILWTSTWLYLVPRGSAAAGSPEGGEATAAESPEPRPKGCEEYDKKQVVLEGLLETSRKV